MKPLITVLMPAYNAEEFIKNAIESILNQSYENFEFLIIDDGSSDSTSDIIDHYQEWDSRIVVKRNSNNRGLINSLNIGLKAASGRYIVRMDADDISYTQRLEKQVQFMESNPEVGVSSSWIKTFGGRKNRVMKSPVHHDQIKAKLFFNSCLWHPASILRMEVIDQHQLRYNEHYPASEDYKLWTEMIKLTKAANIPEVLLRYRRHKNQESRKKNSTQKIRNEQLAQFLSREPNEKEKNLHAKLFLKKPIEKIEQEIPLIEEWITFLEKENEDKNKFIEPVFRRYLMEAFHYFKRQTFYRLIKDKKRYDPDTLHTFFKKPSKFYSAFSTKDSTKVVLKSLLRYPNRYYG